MRQGRKEEARHRTKEEGKEGGSEAGRRKEKRVGLSYEAEESIKGATRAT